MSFNNALTPFWVASGGNAYWNYTFGGGHGAQYAMANCLSPDGQMITTAQGTRNEDNGNVTYYVNFHNNGPQPCFHNLNGGGLT